MQRWHQAFLGLKQIPATISTFEIDHFFTLKPAEMEAVRSRRRPLNRLGIALLIGFLRMTGRTLNSFHIIPKSVLSHLGTQLHQRTPELASIRGLYQRKRTLIDHQRYAAKVLGFSELTTHVERALTTYLRQEVITVSLLALRQGRFTHFGSQCRNPTT